MKKIIQLEKNNPSLMNFSKMMTNPMKLTFKPMMMNHLMMIIPMKMMRVMEMMIKSKLKNCSIQLPSFCSFHFTNSGRKDGNLENLMSEESSQYMYF